MKPFLLSPAATSLDSRPSAATLLASLAVMSPHERTGFLRLYLSEGIPFAFSSAPMVFEAARVWLGSAARVFPRDIAIIGSGKIGYSLSPSKYGRAYGPHSDLDVLIVSKDCFDSLGRLYSTWAEDYHAGRAKPKSERERGFWVENVEICRRNVSKGFLDVDLIPAIYPAASPNFHELQYRLSTKLAATKGSPKFKRASFRIYQTWDDCGAQLMRSLHNLIRSIPPPQSAA